MLISLDTLRRDAIGARTSQGRQVTPHLDTLARRSVRFTRAYVPVPFTLTSHMTLFTGLRPDVHGMEGKGDRLNTKATTLPEFLKRAGYATVGVSTNAWMKGEYGFDRGFDHYEEISPGDTFADRAIDRALSLVDEREASDAPLFLFLHLLDAHSDWRSLPYHSPPEYREGMPVADTDFCNDDGVCATRFLIDADRSAWELSQAAMELVFELYLRGVAYLDAELGRLFGALEQRKIFDEALVIVTSDHGEAFREHGRFLHGQPHEETLAVPLLVKLPGVDAVKPRRESALVSNEDLLPTVLDYLQLTAPADLQGQSLLPVLRGEDAGRDVVVGGDGVHRRRAIADERYRLVVGVEDGGAELFDLQRDPLGGPASRVDRPERVRVLRARLEEQLSEDASLAPKYIPTRNGESILDGDDERWLRSLGYLD